jgi:hypothetical protein
MFDVLEAHAEGAPVSKKAPNWDDVYRSDAFVHWLDQSGPEIEDAVDPFLSALKSWIEEYNLRAPWLGDAAIRTIRALESDLDWKRRPSWVIRSPDIPHGLTISELKFQFSHQFGFGPVLRTRDDMEKEAWREFTKAFNAWFQNLDETLKQRGYEKNRRRDKPERDTRWLVRFQCKREGFAKIAQGQKEVTADVVRHAVDKAAKRLGIERR